MSYVSEQQCLWACAPVLHQLLCWDGYPWASGQNEVMLWSHKLKASFSWAVTPSNGKASVIRLFSIITFPWHLCHRSFLSGRKWKYSISSAGARPFSSPAPTKAFFWEEYAWDTPFPSCWLSQMSSVSSKTHKSVKDWFCFARTFKSLWVTRDCSADKQEENYHTDFSLEVSACFDCCSWHPHVV